MTWACLILATITIIITCYYGIKIAKKHLELFELKIMQAQYDIASSQIYYNEKEMDLLERSCDGAIFAVNKQAEVQHKLNNVIEPEIKKAAALDIAGKFANTMGVSTHTQEMTSFMIEAILGANPEHRGDDDPGENNN